MANLTTGKQNANSNGQIERAATLTQVGWCEIDGNATSGPGVASGTNGGSYALARLADSGIGESNNSCCRNARGNIYLYLDWNPFNADQGGRGNGGRHKERIAAGRYRARSEAG
jgi:hypothetical protein